MTLGALDERDHTIEERVAPFGCDANHDPVRENTRSSCHRGSVPAGLANDWRGFTRDRRFIHRGHAFYDLSVRGNDVARFAHDQVTSNKICRRHTIFTTVWVEPTRVGLDAHPAESFGLSLTPSLGYCFGKVGEEHRERQPDRDEPVEQARMSN